MYNIFFSIDMNDAIIIHALINSIMSNTDKISELQFNFLLDSNTTKEYIDDMMRTMFSTAIYSTNVLNNIDIMFINNNIRIKGPQYLHNTMNFARFWLPIYFPDVDFGLYLDSDMIVLSDIKDVFEYCLFKDSPFWAVKVREDRKGSKKFNAGMYCFDCNYWKRNNITTKCKDIMIEHKNSRDGLFELGTQPILNIIFNKYGNLPTKWHVQHLGYETSIDKTMLNDACLLHWNGHKKPWKNDGLYKEFWNKYNNKI